MAKISDMSDQELGAKMRKILMEYNEHYSAGRLGDDAVPAHEVINGLSRTNREARAAAAGGPVTRNIERGEDDTQPSLSANGNNGNGGATPAMDEASILRRLDARRIAADKLSARYALEDAAADRAINPAKAHQLLRAQRTSPARVNAMAEVIPGYRRLG